MRFLTVLVAAALIVALAGCEQIKDKPKPQPAFVLTTADYAALDGWQADDLDRFLEAQKRSCEKIATLPAERSLGTPALAMTAADWVEACPAVLALDDAASPAAIRSLIEQNFKPFAVAGNGKSDGLFTGYFEAELQAARQKDDTYRYPLYRRPPDHIVVNLAAFDGDLGGQTLVGRLDGQRLVPYYDRAELEAGGLANKGLELFWAKDAVDVFLLQIQGSGRLIMPDGTVERVGFDGHNGRKYESIGKALIERGDLQPGQASWDGIRGWIDANPEKAAELFAINPRFVFFRVLTGDGPIGAQGVALTPRRSLAVDRRFIPLGLPVWLETNWPSDESRKLNRLMVAQDTGGAITGAVRGDFFWGYGAPALAEAGKMKSKGRYFLLLPNPVAERVKQPTS
ncbi:MAG: murein transglycosylase A [Alphaproteobacteria bacterium]